jgi:hypothetical protein
LWLEICLGLAQQRPARKVLSNVLWLRLARLSPPKLGSWLSSQSLRRVHQATPLASSVEKKVEKENLRR